MKRIRIGAAVIAAALVALSAQLPLWTMTMKAPQYRNGLHLYAYGTGMVGDLRELNIINHYIGMATIEPAPPLETALFPIGIAALVVLCLASPFHRWLRRAAIAATLLTPIAVLIDLQTWLYRFGHSLDPHAPIRMKPFTPPVVGSSTLGNFVTTSMASVGLACFVAAAVVLIVAGRVTRRAPLNSHLAGATRMAALLCLFVLGSAPWVRAQASSSLQQRLDRAEPGSTVVVDGGTHHGPLTIHGPMTVIGRNHPVIDGRGVGSVVMLTGDHVVFRGFVVRNSGRQVTEEAAGITVTGNRHRVEDNDIEDVYFGIHIAGGERHVIEGNRITPGMARGARPGHGISVWNTKSGEIRGNRIRDARDGIYLSFTERTLVERNDISGCRYGLHSMYSHDARFVDNRVSRNLLGAALMMSDRLVLRGNRIEQHREGAAAYGMLLKDIGNLTAEDNTIVSNRIGIFAEGVPTDPGAHAVLARNIIAGNEVGLALQSNAALTLTANRIADNLTDVRALGYALSPASRWSDNGRGNSWSQYRGYDADRDGVGDVPHRVDGAMDALVRKSPEAQAFLYTPAHLALEAAARLFPLYRHEPLLVDAHPLMTRTIGGSR